MVDMVDMYYVECCGEQCMLDMGDPTKVTLLIIAYVIISAAK